MDANFALLPASAPTSRSKRTKFSRVNQKMLCILRSPVQHTWYGFLGVRTQNSSVRLTHPLYINSLNVARPANSVVLVEDRVIANGCESGQLLPSPEHEAFGA